MLKSHLRHVTTSEYKCSNLSAPFERQVLKICITNVCTSELLLSKMTISDCILYERKVTFENEKPAWKKT